MLDSVYKIHIHPIACVETDGQRRAATACGFTPIPAVAQGVSSLSVLVNAIIRESNIDYVLLHKTEVLISEGLFSASQDLIRELNADYPNWGVCGATGVRWDGEKTHWYVRRVPYNPEPGVCPKPVIVVGSEALLINVARLRALNCSIHHDTNSWIELGPLLSLECLRSSSCVLADRRLMVVDVGSEPDLGKCEALQQACREYLLNHRLYSPYGAIDIPGVAFDEYLALPPVPHSKVDLLSLFDASLLAARQSRPISISIACRSQFTRPYLLERAFLSFAAACEECPPWLSMNVVVLSDRESELLEGEILRLKDRFPSLTLSGMHVNSRSRETSRIDHLLAAIEGVQSDYIWFVDDDDFIMPGAVPALARTLVPHAPLLVVGTSEVFDEQWRDGQISFFRTSGVYPGSKVFDVFTGENHTPICGMVVPVQLARERCHGLTAAGEYLEDYFVLMRLVTSPRIEIEVLPTVISGISIRGTENTVRETVRDKWNSSYAKFMGEIIRSATSSNPILWQVARQR